MSIWMKAGAAGALALLAACGGNGDDALGDRVKDQAENKADAIEDAADNLPTEAQRDAADNQAKAIREEADDRADAIDDSDVDATKLSDAQKNAIVKAQ